MIEFQGDDAALLIVFLNTHIHTHGQGLFFTQNGGPGISFFNRRVHIQMIPLEIRQCHHDLIVLGLGFLNTEHVGLHTLQRYLEIFFNSSPNTVDVP